MLFICGNRQPGSIVFAQELTQLAAQHVAALPAGAAATAAAQWLSNAAEAIGGAAPQLLLSAATAQELAAAEAAARAAIAAWGGGARAPGQAGAPQQQRQQQSQQQRDWAAVAEWVLGRQQDVWKAVFEASFLSRGKALIADAFTQVCSMLSSI